MTHKNYFFKICIAYAHWIFPFLSGGGYRHRWAEFRRGGQAHSTTTFPMSVFFVDGYVEMSARLQMVIVYSLGIEGTYPTNQYPVKHSCHAHSLSLHDKARERIVLLHFVEHTSQSVLPGIFASRYLHPASQYSRCILPAAGVYIRPDSNRNIKIGRSGLNFRSTPAIHGRAFSKDLELLFQGWRIKAPTIPPRHVNSL